MSKKLIIYILYYELRKLLFGKKYIAGIEATDKCNLRCSHCYYKKYLKRKESIPLSEWERRFKEYYKMGIRLIGFVGGEPSLRYDVLKLSEKYFKFIVVYTNGQIKIPKDFNHRILLSLDGFKEENDKIRGKGTFDKIIKNYKGDKRVVVCSVLSKANYKGEKWLKEFINFVRKMGFSGLNFDFYTRI